MDLDLASTENISRDLEHINSFNSSPDSGITRLPFSKEEIQARSFIKRRMKELGLIVREDAIGNLFGRLEGSNLDLPAVWTGSHIDTVLHGGQFDGTVGVIGALEAIRLIKGSTKLCRRSIEVVVFTSEEPTRFSKGCLGSRALVGKLTLEEIKLLKDKEGKTVLAVLQELGYDLNLFSKLPIKRDSVYAFIELHIEQGAVLEGLGIPIGLVTTISAPTDIHVTIEGKQGHAGATPMDMRFDALTAASEIILKLEYLARTSLSPNAVGTVGKVTVYPNASNVIPGKIFFSIDIRDSDFDAKNDLLCKLKTFIEEVTTRRQVKILTETINHDLPKDADSKIISILKETCLNKSISYHEMVSGAYHDAMFVADFAPFGMIFVPSKEGISHNPQEWTDYTDIAKGVDILAEALTQLANS